MLLWSNLGVKPASLLRETGNSDPRIPPTQKKKIHSQCCFCDCKTEIINLINKALPRTARNSRQNMLLLVGNVFAGVF